MKAKAQKKNISQVDMTAVEESVKVIKKALHLVVRKPLLHIFPTLVCPQPLLSIGFDSTNH